MKRNKILFLLIAFVIFMTVNIILQFAFPFVNEPRSCLAILLIGIPSILVASAFYFYMVKTRESKSFNSLIPKLKTELEYSNYDEVIETLNKINFEEADVPIEYYYLKGLSFYGKDEFPESISNFNQAIFIYKNSKIKIDISILEDSYLKRGEAYYRLNKIQEAEKDFDELLTINSEYKEKIKEINEIKNGNYN